MNEDEPGEKPMNDNTNEPQDFDQLPPETQEQLRREMPGLERFRGRNGKLFVLVRSKDKK